MSLTDYVIMPGADYLDACNATREKTGGTEPIKSGEMGGLIRGISGGGEVIKAMCENETFDLTGDNVEFVSSQAFNGNGRVKSVNLKNAKTIEARAFYNTANLEAVSLPAATSIGYMAFYRMDSKLKQIDIPSAVTVYESAFEGTTANNETVILNTPNVEYLWFNAFRYKNIVTAVFPKLKDCLGSEFYGCKLLTDFSARLLSYTSKEMFFGCEKLKTVDLKNVHKIGESTFSGCVALQDLLTPFLHEIGDFAFEGCTSFQGFIRDATDSLPSPGHIGQAAFSGCTSLTDEAVKYLTMLLPEVSAGTFAECTAITKVDLPIATSVGDQAFSGCINLETVIIRNASTLCDISLLALLNTKIATADGMPTGVGFVYVPTVFFEDYVADITEKAIALAGLDEATAEYIARAILRKTEDYPEICG